MHVDKFAIYIYTYIQFIYIYMHVDKFGIYIHTYIHKFKWHIKQRGRQMKTDNLAKREYTETGNAINAVSGKITSNLNAFENLRLKNSG